MADMEQNPVVAKSSQPDSENSSMMETTESSFSSALLEHEREDGEDDDDDEGLDEEGVFKLPSIESYNSMNIRLSHIAANEVSLLTAPIIVTVDWWINLDQVQRVLLFTFIFIYGFTTLFCSILIGTDHIYRIHLNLRNFERKPLKVTAPYNLSLTITRGFWRTEIVQNYPDIVPGLSRRELYKHADAGLLLWKTCKGLTYRGKPCEGAAVFCCIFALGVFYFHCTAFFLFRVLTILNLTSAAFMIMIGFALMFASADEYLYCLTLLNSKGNGRDGYFRGRKWDNEISFDVPNLVLMCFTIFGLCLPMIIIGIYLLVFRRTNL